MTVQADILEAWAEENQAVRIRFSKIGCLWAMLLIPAGVTLDILVYPHWWTWFFLLRVVGDLIILGVFLAHFTQFGCRHVRVLTLAWLVTPQVVICYMLYLADGFASTYYAGLNLAILGMGIVMPVTVAEVATLSGLTLSLYLIAGIAHASSGVDSNLVYNNLYFILITSVISGIAVYFYRRQRFTEFRLNFELTRRNKDLAELDRVKSDFFANVSHELRTPLTLILAPLDRLLEDSQQLPGRVADKLDLVRQNGLRLLRLVNDLLEVIRLEDGRVDLDRRALRLDTLLGSVVDAMSDLAESRGIAIENQLADTPSWIHGDRGALEKIFFNLLSNALKFTNEGGAVVVSSHLDAQSITITVDDTGIGMSRETLPHVFDRFHQGDSSATRKYPGTGLGLALVKELTERHGGEVTITSRLGEGTKISTTLPILSAEDVDPEAIQDESESESATQRRLDIAAQRSAVRAPRMTALCQPGPDDAPGETVLIVDDEPDMRHYLVDLLQDEYHILEARDGKEGLEMAQRFRPALIVLDLMLPEIDGLEVCRCIKQSPELQSSRIVLLTARADESSKLVALQNGASDFLTKPFSGTEVTTRLRNLQHSARLEQDLHHRNHELEGSLTALRETQDKLIHSEKLNALGRLSAGLLHEINNPLNYTLAALELARSDSVVGGEDELRETLSDIDDGMQRIRGIVKELRAFAYPSKSEQVAFRLPDAIDAALQILAHDARGASVHNLVEAEWTVVGSRNHITQVVVNLLSNALKAVRSVADQRSGEIVIREYREGGRVYVAVRDNGSGISEDALDRVFDPFYTTREIGEGMGMGLSVCQTIIRNHDGELRVDSEEGAWTEFTFDLTLEESNQNLAYSNEHRAASG